MVVFNKNYERKVTWKIVHDVYKWFLQNRNTKRVLYIRVHKNIKSLGNESKSEGSST